MAFKTVTDLSCDTTITIGGFNKKLKKDNPTQIEGYYLGKKKIDDKKKTSGFSYLYTVQTPKGNVGVWGRTDLDRKLASVEPGTMVRISAAGTLVVPTGEMYKYKVEVDEDNTIEVSAESSEAPQAASYSDDDESYVNNEGDVGTSYEEPEQDEDELQAQALAAAEARKAKVAALLKPKNKN